MNNHTRIAGFWLAMAFGLSASFEVASQTAAELIELDFEDLLNMSVEVESAGKNKARALDLPYSAFVISREEIDATGVTHIAEALSMAPGVTVDRLSNHEWSVAIRGAGGRFSRFVLVLIDGRIAYNTLFSGVNWDELNLTLANVDRIEVIRGPNAAAWGANAVNGIINIITRTPSADQASVVAVEVGEGGRRQFSGRAVGGLGEWQLGVSGHWSALDGWTSEAGLVEADAENGRLSLSMSRDHQNKQMAISADVYAIRQGALWGWVTDEPSYAVAVNPEEKEGASFQYLLNWDYSSRWQWQFRASLDSVTRRSDLMDWDSSHYQFDVDFFGRYDNHAISAGVNTRISNSNIETIPDFNVTLLPEERTVNTLGLYVSDVWQLSPSFETTLSARVDYNELSETAHLQPSIRGLWRHSDRDRIWFALSKATSTTARALVDTAQVSYALAPAQPPEVPFPVLLEVVGTEEDLQDTFVVAAELGYRKTFDAFSVDVSLFDYQYKHDAFIVPLGDPALQLDASLMPAFVQQNALFANVREFSSRGFEFSTRAAIAQFWTTQWAYAYIDTDAIYSSWRHSLNIINTLTIHSRWQLTWMLTHKDDNLYSAIEGYTLNHFNLNWSADDHWQLRLSLNNVGDKHPEGVREFFPASAMIVEPFASLKIGYTF